MNQTALKHIPIAKLGKAFGVQGWMKVYSYTDPFTKLFDYKNLYIQEEHEWQPFSFDKHRQQGKNLVAHIPGCNTPEAACAFTNKEIAITADLLEKLPEGEYYWHELEGLTVINQENKTLGTLSHFLNTGANDVMVVVKPEEKDRWIPYLRDQIVLRVDQDKKEIHVEWDEDF